MYVVLIVTVACLCELKLCTEEEGSEPMTKLTRSLDYVKQTGYQITDVQGRLRANWGEPETLAKFCIVNHVH